MIKSATFTLLKAALKSRLAIATRLSSSSALDMINSSKSPPVNTREAVEKWVTCIKPTFFVDLDNLIFATYILIFNLILNKFLQNYLTLIGRLIYNDINLKQV